MSLTPTAYEPDHDASSYESCESVPRLHVLTPYDELSKAYPPESLDWRDPCDKQSSYDSVAVNETNKAIKKYRRLESLDWHDLHENKVEGCIDGVDDKANRAFTLKKLPRLSELLDWRDLYGLKVTSDSAKKLSDPYWNDLHNKQVTYEDSVVIQNVFNKTEMVIPDVVENRRLLKRENNYVDVKADNANEITKSLLQKYIKEASLKKTDGVVKDDDEHWTILPSESKSFSQIALGIETDQPKDGPSSPGLLSWLVDWCSFLWNKLGFLYTQKDSSLQTSNPSGSSKEPDGQLGDEDRASQSVSPEGLKNLPLPPPQALSQ